MSTNERELHTVSIMIVDDEPANIRLLERMLQRAGYRNVHATTDPLTAASIAILKNVDIMLVDLHMPGRTGVDVLTDLAAAHADFPPMVIILTGDDTREAKAKALSTGAKDFIAKPFDNSEVLLRIRNLADLRLMHKRLHESNVDLEAKVSARTAQLEEARRDVIDRLGKAAEFRDDDTGQHTRRVGVLAARLSQALGCSNSDVELIQRAAPLHDVGKIAIPDHILLKRGPLDDMEMRIMRTHSTVGAELLSGSRSPVLMTAREIALSHHERWDGTGYPNGWANTAIPKVSRIVALADFFDALSHDRPYRQRYPVPRIIEMIQNERGRHFDPEIVDAFLTMADPAELTRLAIGESSP